MSAQDPTQVDPRDYEQHPDYRPPQPPPHAPPYEPPPGYAQQPYQQAGQDGPPSQGERWRRNPAEEAAHFAKRHLRTPETKEFFRTSEFLVWLIASAAILIAGIIAGPLDAEAAWTLVAGLSGAYILSRGISKAGTRRGWEDSARDQAGAGGSGAGSPNFP